MINPLSTFVILTILNPVRIGTNGIPNVDVPKSGKVIAEVKESKVDNELKINDDKEIHERIKIECEPTSVANLNRMLGSAFNGRYMAVQKPDDTSISQRQRGEDGVRSDEVKLKTVEDFAVGDGFSRILREIVNRNRRHVIARSADQEILDNKTSKSLNFVRTKLKTDDEKIERRDRSVSSHGAGPWKCESRLHWLDLGHDYFPRYLRTVICTAERCWFKHFKCEARAFTVKVLRRRRDGCFIDVHNSSASGNNIRMVEDWVFEERAVNFCCECTI